MRKIILFVSMLMVTSHLYAQTIYDQKTYVFTGLPDGSNIIEDADAEAQCMEGIEYLAKRDFHGINPNYFLRIKIHSVDIAQKNGKMKRLLNMRFLLGVQ